MDRLGPLNAFVHAAESRSFTVAGRELGISASGIGKAVSRLETRLNVQLFHRNTRIMSLTPEGAVFLTRCQKIFAEIEAAEVEIAQSTTEARGKMRVSLPLIGMLIMPAIAAFAEAYPEIDLDLDFTDRLVDIIEEGVDVVIRTGTVDDSRLKMRKLGSYSYVIVGSPAYFDNRGIPENPEDLVNHSCLYHRWSSSGKLERWILGRDGVELDFVPPVSLVATTMEPLIALAEHHRGVMYAPSFTVRHQLLDGTLRSVLDPFLPAAGSLQALWPSTRHGSPKVRAFVDFIIDSLLADKAWDAT